MKIFFVNTNSSWGGGEKWHLDTACAMGKKGHSTTILTLRGKELYNKALSSGINVIPVQISNLSFLNPYRLFSIYRLLKTEKPDVIILNFSSDVKTAGVAARFAGIRKIIYRRGNAKPIRNTLLNRLIYKKIITHVIANSQETKRSILQNNTSWFPSEKINVIYNGINLGQFDSLPDIHLYGRKNDETVVGSAGRLSHEKGQKFLIEMVLNLKKHHSNFTLLIAGEGQMAPELKEIVKKAGIEDHVVFLGFIANMKAFMDTIDIFVLPSLWEGFGYVTIEAMAGGKPVVAFNTGSNPEIIRDTQTGFLINDYDIVAFSDKVSLLMKNAELAKTLGQAGRKRVTEFFNSERAMNEIELFLSGS